MQGFIMKRLSVILYVIFALLFIFGIIIKNKYVVAAGLLIAAMYFAITAVITKRRSDHKI